MNPEVKAQRMEALGLILAKKREEAILARKESGIEEVWRTCEDAYLGIDDANRGDFEKAKWAKSTSMAGPLTSNTPSQPSSKSTAYVRLTTRYVDMGAAKVSEIVLPIDDKAFSFGPTPVPNLIKQQGDTSPVMINGQMVWRDAREGELGSAIQSNPAGAMQGSQAGAKPQVPVTVKDVAEVKMRQAKEAATKAETRIYDWMVESKYPMQMRKVIHDSARIGVGVIKGPFPTQRKSKAFSVKNGVGMLQIASKTSPACQWIDPWNLFPDGSCGENIQDGEYIFERDFMSERKLRALKELKDIEGHPIYLGIQIDKVLKEGPEKINVSDDGSRNPSSHQNKNRFSIWYFTGTLKREDMAVLGAVVSDDLPDDVTHCHAICTMVNDSVIRATINPLDKSGNFPYRAFSWSRRAGHWAGVGVAEQVSMPQRAVNAGTRSFFNNAGKSAGSQIVMDQRAIIPADGSWDLGVGDKLWFMTGDALYDDIRKAFVSITVPNLGEQLLRVIEYGFKLAEEQSNIPLISQGQTGPTDPKTFGQAELQNNNANTLLRDKAYALDDDITEPLVNDFYEWLLMDPDVPEDEKGDFEINARGSIAMVEKAIQEQTLMTMLPLSLNPAWGQDPKKFFAELMKSKRMDPGKTAYTEEELAQMQSQPPPKAPVVQAAEIRAQVDLHKTEMTTQANERIAAGHDQATIAKSQADTDRDAEYTRAETERTKITQQAALERLYVEREIAMMKMMNEKGMSQEDAKTALARTVMELQTQVRLSMGSAKNAPQVATPAIEPPGRAPDGQAFQK